MSQSPFLVMTCPSCGASLDGVAEQGALRCKYCGNLLVPSKGEPEEVSPHEMKATASTDTPSLGTREKSPGSPDSEKQVGDMIRAHISANMSHSTHWSVYVIIFGLLGSVIGFSAFMAYREQSKRTRARAADQKRYEEEQKQREYEQKERERIQKEQQALAAREDWKQWVDREGILLPKGLDELIGAQLPENWPIIRIGSAQAPLTIIWYATYTSPNDKDFNAAVKSVMRRLEGKIRLEVVPLPDEQGHRTVAMDSFLALLDLQGADALLDLHQRLTQDGYRAITYDRSYLALCRAVDCDMAQFKRSLRQRPHHQRIQAVVPIARKLNMRQKTLFRIKNHLFEAPIGDDALERLVRGFLDPLL